MSDTKRVMEEVEILTCKQRIKNSNDIWTICGKEDATYRVHSEDKEKRKNCYCDYCYNELLEYKKAWKQQKQDKEEEKISKVNHCQ